MEQLFKNSPIVDSTQEEAVEWLMKLIAIPSFSKEEEGTADLLYSILQERNVNVKRSLNNVWATNKYFDEKKPTILLNSHHDTVKPSPSYSFDPFHPFIQDGKLFGLGSNDAGGALISLLSVFLHFYEREDLRYNLIFAATAEEEISGKHGIESLLPQLGKISFAIVGEPTQMQMAVAEKGLLVLDVLVKGRAGHAARNEGINAIALAIKDMNWFMQYSFDKVSPLLGPVKMSVTVIESKNKAHNVVPDEVRFTVDIRTNELYSHEEILAVIQKNVIGEITARSLRLRSTSIDLTHPVIMAGLELGRTCFGSPTLSDKALMPFPALKMGPGHSERSHSADEFIHLHELKEGIDIYTQLLSKIL